MSDLFRLHDDVVNAADKLYPQTITVDENEYEIAFRQTRDGEDSPFHSVVDEEKRKEWKEAYESIDESDMDESDLKRLRKLQLKKKNGRLNDAEENELEKLSENTQGIQELMRLIVSDKEAVDALKEIAKTVVEPDDDDIQEILSMTPVEQDDRFDTYATDEEGAREIAQDMLEELVNKSTNYSAVALGLQGLFVGESAGHDPKE